MNVYIVTYDLINPNKNHNLLSSKIRSHEYWAKLGYSVYLVATEASAVELRDKLKCSLDKNDKLFVAKITVPAAWTNHSSEVSNWIKQYLA